MYPGKRAEKTEEGQYNGPGGICHILFGDARGKYICIKFYMISLLIDNFFFCLLQVSSAKGRCILFLE